MKATGRENCWHLNESNTQNFPHFLGLPAYLIQASELLVLASHGFTNLKPISNVIFSQNYIKDRQYLYPNKTMTKKQTEEKLKYLH